MGNCLIHVERATEAVWLPCNDAGDGGSRPGHGRGDATAPSVPRIFQASGGWIKALLEEAENERMHLMTMVELVQPMWYERLLVLTVQGVFFNAFFVLYLLSPKMAHRVVGYLEEEAIHSYTEYLTVAPLRMFQLLLGCEAQGRDHCYPRR